MNELSTEIKTHVIIFHDKSKRFITEKTYNRICACTTPVFNSPETASITLSSIAKIPSLALFYEDYPNEIPVTSHYSKEIPSNEDQRTEAEQQAFWSRNRIRMLEGIKSVGTPDALELFRMISNPTPEGKEGSYYQKVFDKYSGKANRTPSEEAHFQFAKSKVLVA